jgi:beta-lactam-binding protein with PASTA domain
MLGLHQGLQIKQFESPDASALSGLQPPIPDVRGMTRDAAVTSLLDAGFRVRISTKTAAANPQFPVDQVADQSPSAGSVGDYDSVVTLTLTDGSQTNVSIPAPWQVPRTVSP